MPLSPTIYYNSSYGNATMDLADSMNYFDDPNCGISANRLPSSSDVVQICDEVEFCTMGLAVAGLIIGFDGYSFDSGPFYAPCYINGDISGLYCFGDIEVRGYQDMSNFNQYNSTLNAFRLVIYAESTVVLSSFAGTLIIYGSFSYVAGGSFDRLELLGFGTSADTVTVSGDIIINSSGSYSTYNSFCGSTVYMVGGDHYFHSSYAYNLYEKNDLAIYYNIAISKEFTFHSLAALRNSVVAGASSGGLPVLYYDETDSFLIKYPPGDILGTGLL